MGYIQGGREGSVARTCARSGVRNTASSLPHRGSPWARRSLQWHCAGAAVPLSQYLCRCALLQNAERLPLPSRGLPFDWCVAAPGMRAQAATRGGNSRMHAASSAACGTVLLSCPVLYVGHPRDRHVLGLDCAHNCPRMCPGTSRRHLRDHRAARCRWMGALGTALGVTGCPPSRSAAPLPVSTTAGGGGQLSAPTQEQRRAWGQRLLGCCP